MPAILSITYTPNYPSNHRICFRTTGSAYCCYNDDSTSVIGVPKTVEIELEDFELCLQDLPAEVGCAGSVVEGYVQPICIEQGSDVNRVAFTATFPSAPCSAYNIECQESGIAEIELTEQGLGWLPGDIATITIIDNSGYGSGATAEAIMACNDSNICYVESILITDPGEFYYFANQISVDISLPIDIGGTPATAIVSSVDNCSTFTVPDCDGTANPTTYQLWAGSQYAINICAGSPGPDAFKYIVTPDPIDISCCDCVKYDVINTELSGTPIQFYYTDCVTQTITLAALDSQDTTQVCAVRSSVWPSDPNNNQYFEYISSATQDC